MESSHRDRGCATRQDLLDAAYAAASDAAFGAPGTEQPVALMPWITVMLAAIDNPSRLPKGSIAIIQDPRKPYAMLCDDARVLADMCDRLDAPNCARALRGPLPRGAAWSVVGDELGYVAVLLTRDTRIARTS